MINLQHYWVYDIETYPNVFTACFINAQTNEMRQYEISDQRNDRDALLGFMNWLCDTKCIGVGFNNVGFDYPVMHTLYRGGDWYQKVQDIIGGEWEDRFNHVVWENDQIFPQLDLYKIHHFDNKNKQTSLKDLEIVMRSETVQDLPFEPGTHLTPEQITVLHKYNEKDVRETLAFFKLSLEKIEFRETLSKRYGRNFANHNDTKIGAEIFVDSLEKAGIECYYRDATNKRSPRQTWRSHINVNEILLQYNQFETEEFNTILKFFKSQVIKQTKGAFSDVDVSHYKDEWLNPKEEWPSGWKITPGKVASSLHIRFKGVTYYFGTGGIHGATQNRKYKSDDEMMIEMRDVKSYYPNLSIVNKIYPEHLTPHFCVCYEGIYDERAATPKSDPINGALKLALNGTYGNSNNQYSVFYDPKFTMAITINGQLGLCVLIEQLVKVPKLEMINVNTDGVGFIYPRKYRGHVDAVCHWWETLTGLILEREEFNEFYQRDVNNYLGVDKHGKIKRKGAYEYEIEYHQDPSSLIVQKAVEQYLVNGTDVTMTIVQCTNPYDFMIRAKVRRNVKLYFGDRETQRITRFFVALNGVEITHITPCKHRVGSWKPARGVTEEQYQAWIVKEGNEIDIAHSAGLLKYDPIEDFIIYDDGTREEIDSYSVRHNPQIHTKNKSKWEDSKGRFVAGWQAVECADVADFDWDNLNYAYYINEALKLVENLK